jgi:hypothetical protein
VQWFLELEATAGAGYQEMFPVGQICIGVDLLLDGTICEIQPVPFSLDARYQLNISVGVSESVGAVRLVW